MGMLAVFQGMSVYARVCQAGKFIQIYYDGVGVGLVRNLKNQIGFF